MSLPRQNLPARLPAPENVTLLAVSPYEEDSNFLRRAFRHPQWRIEWVKDCGSACELFAGGSCPCVVLCESDLPDGNWRDILRTVQSLTNPPNLVVASRNADEYLWGEVLNLGGYDVLAKPFDPAEVLRVIGMASRQFAGRHERRTDASSVAAAGASYLYGS